MTNAELHMKMKLDSIFLLYIALGKGGLIVFHKIFHYNIFCNEDRNICFLILGFDSIIQKN